MILAEKELEIPDQSFFKYTVHLINNVITNTPVFNLKTILIRYITKRKFQMKLTILNTVTIIIYIYIYTYKEMEAIKIYLNLMKKKHTTFIINMIKIV